MNRDTKKPTKKNRRVISWAPSGPIRSILECELRGKGRGALADLLNKCLIETLGPKYPKFTERFQILSEEK